MKYKLQFDLFLLVRLANQIFAIVLGFRVEGFGFKVLGFRVYFKIRVSEGLL